MDKIAQSQIMQNIEFTEEDLHALGWRISEAAREFGVSHQHLGQVLRGQRKSARLIKLLRRLPKKALRDRKPINNL